MVLEKIDSPSDLRIIDKELLKPLVDEIRQKIIETTSVNGGHLAPSLGVIELTVALHYCYNAPEDKIVWDVGHQSYAHKIITGRRDRFSRLRQLGGISGFPNRSESEYDAFGTGHSSTSISAALGMACARDLKGEDHRVVAVIGDGSLTGGLAYEGLNNAGHLKKDMLVVLNDNEMFISSKVGAMGEYLTRILTFEPIYKIEGKLKKILQRHPKWGEEIIRIARRSKTILTPGMLFEEMGFEYYGPVDGHDLDSLIDILHKVRDMQGPVLLHVRTTKGKGYEPAERNPETFHGTSPFEIETGEALKKGSYVPNYQDIFGDVIVELAKMDPAVVAITAAMSSGTGLDKFKKRFPERFFDVGIAEQHAVTFAAGLATQGIKPVCAIYSTFLQRSYDQIIHDVALQELPVVFAIDRSGLVGEDGPTHHGMFDLSYLASIPNMIVAAPADENEMRNLFYSSLTWKKPAAIRYPRGKCSGTDLSEEFTFISPGNGRIVRVGEDLVIIAIGNMVQESLKAAEILHTRGINASVIDLRFAKPLDKDLIIKEALNHGNVLTVEDNTIEGGVGERIKRILPQTVNIDIIAIPDSFVTYGDIKELRSRLDLDREGISQRAAELVTAEKKN